MTDNSTRVPFWRAAPAIAHRGKRKLLIAYDGSVERSGCFPVPFTASSLRRLARRIACPRRQAVGSVEPGMAIHGSAQLDYSDCTHGRGHFVPEVVSVEKQDTSGGVA
jgi:hypothetical protein